ncbi:hypothetical protein ACA910_004799 [Epithemia clementina (nom. ined.)]
MKYLDKRDQQRITDILEFQATQLHTQSQQFHDLNQREDRLTEQIHRGFYENHRISTALLEVIGEFVISEVKSGSQFDLTTKLRDRLDAPTSQTQSPENATPLEPVITTRSQLTNEPEMENSPPRNDEKKRPRSTDTSPRTGRGGAAT